MCFVLLTPPANIRRLVLEDQEVRSSWSQLDSRLPYFLGVYVKSNQFKDWKTSVNIRQKKQNLQQEEQYYVSGTQLFYQESSVFWPYNNQNQEDAYLTYDTRTYPPPDTIPPQHPSTQNDQNLTNQQSNTNILIPATPPTPPSIFTGNQSQANTYSLTQDKVKSHKLSICSRTSHGCTCKQKWNFSKKLYQGCQNPDDDPNGPWCYVEEDCLNLPSQYIVNNLQGDYVGKYDYCDKPC
eukprot:TRINITY_DN90825_c0_g1_i3.p2 TRINITY_DN90825_c0_g1~~TRINITY_DN90825_c0_g1_i3.p2  ORF type:complete len:238 (+),score=13.69 TRINITY_DN90825_c0_g1_i3:890-1603(+)